MEKEKAVVLLSGGLDSCTALSEAIKTRRCYALSVFYGQRHQRELLAAERIVSHYRQFWHLDLAGYRVVRIDNGIHGSALTGDAEVPEGRSMESMGQDIPVTYVPARNTIMLSLAASYAEELGASEIWTGFNALDYSGYPDCREDYTKAMEAALALGTKCGVEGRPLKIVAPLVHKTKAEVVELAIKNNAPVHSTWSCYKGGAKPCGKCDSCLIRVQAFSKLGVHDPASLGGVLCLPLFDAWLEWFPSTGRRIFVG